MDHDQRFKTLLEEFLLEFFLLFFPHWAERFDFSNIVWLKQEIFTDPPTGERRALDLIAQLPTRQGVPGRRPHDPESWIALIHVDVESDDWVAAFRPRMYDYYTYLRRKHRLPVLPIGLYLRVGLEGVGVEVYEEYFWELRPLRFEFLYVGLPRLDGLRYLDGDNWLGVALSALMKIPADKRAWFKAEALRRLVACPENDHRRFLLCECVQAYLPLEPPELREFEHLLVTPPYQEVSHMQKTWYEQGIDEGVRKTRQEVGQMQTTWFEQGFQEGLQKGRQEARNILQGQLEERFGPLSPKAQERLESWPEDRLMELARALMKAHSLQDLDLGN